MRLRRALVLGLLAASLAACTGGDGGGGAGDEGGGAPDPGEGATPTAAGSPLAAPGLETAVELTSPPTEGAGEVPAFGWTAVAGASAYRLVVLGSDGGPIWAWEGTETTVNLGGLPGDRPVGEAGPVIEAGSSWTVVALDAEGHVVAASPVRPVSP